MSFAVEPSPEIWNRDDLPALCFWRKLYRCVEVGVDRAAWASLFLARFPQVEDWWGVDAYAPYPEMLYPREADYLMAVDRLKPYSDRAKLLRMPSADAAALFSPGSVDFCYVDGDHTLASVRADLNAWWPKISDKGILAGHDFDDQPVHSGVKQAVTEFASERGLTVYLTAVPPYNIEVCPSFYMYRSGIPAPDWRRC